MNIYLHKCDCYSGTFLLICIVGWSLSKNMFITICTPVF